MKYSPSSRWLCCALLLSPLAHAVERPRPVMTNMNEVAARPALPAPQSRPSLPGPWSVTAAPVIDFEGYTVGGLGGQAGWWNPAGNGRDAVIAGGISGQSGRVLADASATFGVPSMLNFEPGYGVFSMDVRVPPLDTFFLFGIFSEVNGTSGLLDPQAMLLMGGDREVTMYQRTRADQGDYVRLDLQLAENTVARLSWDIRADGSARLYRDGRLITIGQAESTAITGAPRQMSALQVGTSNNVTLSADGSRNALVFDNIGPGLPTVNDLPDEADLAIIVSFGRIAPGQALRTSREIAVNGSSEMTFIGVNSGAAPATNAHFGGILPAGYQMTGITCPVTQNGDAWDTAPVTIAPGQTLTCQTRLTIPAGTAPNGWVVGSVINSDAPDPFGGNNVKSVVMYTGVFASGFE